MKIKQMIPMFITERLSEVKAFYTEHLRFKVTHEGPGFLGLKSLEHEGVELTFMPPDNEPLRIYSRGGMMLCLMVEDVDAEYDRLTTRGVRSAEPPKDNPWGDRSFWIEDPIGVILYIYKPIPPSPEYLSYARE